MQFTVERIRANSGNPADAILVTSFSKWMYNGFIRLYNSAKTYVLPLTYLDYRSEIENFEIRPDDTFVVTHPKTGTTWTLEMVWCIVNDCNFKEAKEVEIHWRAPHFDLSSMFRKIATYFHQILKCSSFEIASNSPSPRVLKSHLPYELLPKALQEGQAKIIYVTRNPKDTCVSFFHFAYFILGYFGSLEQFVELFTKNALYYGNFWDHVLGYWDQRHRSNVLFITYEQMQSDLRAVVLRVAEFLGKELTEENVQELLHHLSFEEMKKNKAVNWEFLAQKIPRRVRHDGVFMRSGKVGAFKEALNDDMLFKIGKMTHEKLKNSDFDLSLFDLKTNIN